MPNLTALSATCWADICPANGVLLRLPLKPLVPALAQQSTSPLVSVMVIVVLLNVALMWATPTVTLRRTFRRAAAVRLWFWLCHDAFRSALKPARRRKCPVFCRRPGVHVPWSRRNAGLPKPPDPLRVTADPSRPSCRRPSSSDPCACGRWCGCAGREPAARGDAGCRDSSRYPAAA